MTKVNENLNKIVADLGATPKGDDNTTDILGEIAEAVGGGSSSKEYLIQPIDITATTTTTTAPAYSVALQEGFKSIEFEADQA